MRLLEFTQLANNTLGTVDTARSLVTRPQGSGSVSALSQQIDSVGAVLTSEIRGARDVLQRDIGTVTSMVSQVSAQQAMLRQEIHHVIEGVAGLNVLMKKHMHSVEDQLRFLIDEPLQNACYQLTAYLTNKEGVGATDEEIRGWLRILESWISKAGMRKIMTISSEDAAALLSQSPDNIAFIASRLHLLFGDIIPEKFLLLPPASLKFYFTVVTLFLKGLEKNPHLLGIDKAQSICQEIQNTLNTYFEFSNFIKQHPELVQALFDLHDYHRDKVGLLIRRAGISIDTSRGTAYVKPLLEIMESSPVKREFEIALSNMEEIYLLLGFSVRFAQGNVSAELLDRFSKFDSMKDLYEKNAPRIKEFYTTGKLSEVCTPVELQRMRYRIGFQDLICDHNTWMLDFLQTSSIQLKNLAGYFQQTIDRLFLVISLLSPEETTYITANLLGYAGSYRLVPYSSITADGLGSKFHRPYTYSSLILLLNIFGSFGNYEGQLPKEEMAFHQAKYQADGLLADYKLKTTFEYYKLMSQGRLREANLLLLKTSGSDQFVDHYCLLFLAAIIGPKEGRWDIFESFVEKYSLPANFNFSQTLKNGTLTPLMIAAQHGRKKVVNALLLLIYRPDIVKLSSENKTAAQLAREQGFEDIAVMIERAQRGILPSIITTPAAVTDYEKSLAEISSSVTVSKTKLGQYIPAPLPAQQVALAAQAADPLPDEETDDEQESALEKTTREFFSEHGKHAGRASFWKKPT